MPVTRRLLLAASLAAPFLAPARALAAIHAPLKEPPPRARPLGIWNILVRRLEVVQDGTAAVDVVAPLQFKSQIEVATPVMRYWRLEAMAGPRVAFPIPKTELNLPALNSGIWTDVPPQSTTTPVKPAGITLTVPADVLTVKNSAISPPKTVRQAGFRISCDMTDPVSKRRAVYSFVLTVLDRPRS